MAKDKPDMFAENKAIMPYGDNVGAPAIRPTNIEAYKQEKILKTNHYFEARFNEIKDEYKKLLEEFKWNDLVYNAKFNFEPVIGETYYLYVGDDHENFLSLISPNEWNRECLGSFYLNAEQKWVKI